MRFIRAYLAVFSITVLATTLPTGVQGLVHARTIVDARYDNTISVDSRMWLMVAGFAIAVALTQSLYTRRRRGRLRAYEFCIALFLGIWVAAGTTIAFATAEWGGLMLAGVSGAIAPLVPWTEPGASLPRRAGLSVLAVAAVTSMALSSAQFFDSSFLFYLFTAPLAAAGGAVGMLGAERIVEYERERLRLRAAHREPGGGAFGSSDRSVA